MNKDSLVYGIAGVAILAVLLDVDPKLGGWLLVLVTLGLVLKNSKALGIISAS